MQTKPPATAKLRLLGGFITFLVSLHLLAYQTQRSEFTAVLFWIGLCFLGYLIILKNAHLQPYRQLFWGALLLRLSLLFALPELSDDFYRFIWDGKLWLEGVHPFSVLPSELISTEPFSSDPSYLLLYEGLNSPQYFTVYPPLSQLSFVSAAALFPSNILGNVVVMRLFILAAEFGTLWMLPKALSRFNIKPHYALVYAFNPLVIVELTGNLHFEAVMIFCLVMAIYFYKQNIWCSAVFMGLAVSTKLVPLIFLPLILGRQTLTSSVRYYLLTALVVVVCFVPLYHPAFIKGMSTSIGLYFQKFEFNASIYYLVREAGYLIKGYNIIQVAGKYLALTSLISILTLSYLSYKKIKWPLAMMWSLLIYLVLTTTVHPWYVTTLVMLCCFTSMRFPVLWSILIFLSYAGYQTVDYTENLVLVWFQYSALALLLFLELRGWKVNLFAANKVYITP